MSNTDNSITAAPNTLDTLLIGEEDSDHNEDWDGLLGFAYLYPGELSAGWISAEYDNLNDPASFYSISAVTGITETPIMGPTSGGYPAGTTVEITCSTPSSTIYYTTDGSPPDSGSSVYTTPITISDGMNIKAFATAAGYTDSEVASETYTILVAAAQPIITVIT